MTLDPNSARLNPFDIRFTPVSPRYGLKEVVSSLVFFVPFILAALLCVIFYPEQWWLHIVWGGLTVWTIIYLIIVVRQARVIGYAERDEDLLVRRGIMFQRTTVVPYGRLQFVDVDSGPIDRMFGLATVKLHTASAATDATIPGLPKADADRLRDSLAGLGKANLAGL